MNRWLTTTSENEGTTNVIFEGVIMPNATLLTRRIRCWLILYILALLFWGITTFPLEWEINILQSVVSSPNLPLANQFPALVAWIQFVSTGLRETYRAFPFLAYGTDWLGYAHIVIAIAFVGPLREPIRNRWIVEWGMLCCLLVIPLALIMGPLRGIPFFWTLVDCSFGVGGIIPLWLVRRDIVALQSLAPRALA